MRAPGALNTENTVSGAPDPRPNCTTSRGRTWYFRLYLPGSIEDQIGVAKFDGFCQAAVQSHHLQLQRHLGYSPGKLRNEISMKDRKRERVKRDREELADREKGRGTDSK